MPFATEPKLKGHAKYFYLKTGGCIGILKNWLDLVVKNALDAGVETFDRDYADLFAHSNISVRTVLEEAFAGESKLKDIELRDVEELLKKRHEFISMQPEYPKPKAVPKKKSIRKGSVRGQIGKRNPVRDSTGTQHELSL
jgi:hypothetical protein